MTKKLKILGPYTPDHEGPFCTRDGRPVRIITRAGGSEKYPVVAIIDGCDLAGSFEADGSVISIVRPKPDDLMNAEEVPEAREFWINEYRRGDGSIGASRPRETECEAARECQELPHWNWVRTIHVREVLPGEGE
ncbi:MULTISPECIES: hypothetical protein [Acetobacter]|uniref:Uncharacterized protein n=2 Tax=Acetobacter TaxID=434 RepID=A0AAN1PK05_9PROT|nr:MULTISPECIES: hypothetical protein [Acetobacter]ASL39287.1 hypothetical protein CBI36_01730 [Acetobacter oryzifermentans]AXN01414.1 hypothetical protein CJF59_13295 [Acetobacter pomorum]KAA8397194.1 hypothetical protein FKW22_05345 [Acetobacter sp. DmW_125124]KAA8397740.1 hypothetical protein FKW20_08775 [Acetobacter sp. DmW_125127]KAA8401143.1 hypothetical protein FKW19_00590 [Acetobacter sp. DmW_125128]